MVDTQAFDEFFHLTSERTTVIADDNLIMGCATLSQVSADKESESKRQWQELGDFIVLIHGPMFRVNKTVQYRGVKLFAFVTFWWVESSQTSIRTGIGHSECFLLVLEPALSTYPS